MSNTSKISHSDLLKVSDFCKYIAENWLPETLLSLVELYYEGGILTFFFESPSGGFDGEIKFDSVDNTSIEEMEVSVYTCKNEKVETISLRNIVGNY
jgi:hypothetical protein